MIATPEWFTQAINSPSADHTVEVDECRIHYRTWTGPVPSTTDRKPPALMLVHGGGAHVHWWDFVAPFLAQERTVVALDVGGMGDSGHRNHYSPDLFIDEVLAVQQAAGLTGSTAPPTVLLGHSMGGAIALKTLAQRGETFAGLIMADSPIHPPEDAARSGGGKSPFKPKQTYATREQALARFRLLPAQPCANQYIVDYLAATSLTEVPGGWSWKFDDQVFKTSLFGHGEADVAQLRRPMAMIYGEKSRFYPARVLEKLRRSLPRGTPLIGIPEAHHHLFLDQPLAFVAALRALLATWPAACPTPAADG